MTRAFPPLYECPKCGDTNSFTTPRYRTFEGFLDNASQYFAPGTREWLEWPCDTCGYEVEGPTNDAREAAS